MIKLQAKGLRETAKRWTRKMGFTSIRFINFSILLFFKVKSKNRIEPSWFSLVWFVFFNQTKKDQLFFDSLQIFSLIDFV
jgi:hypothetical protein